MCTSSLFCCPTTNNGLYIWFPLAAARPVIGTWDDHDAGVNDGNSLFPHKHAFKQLFLDALGEPQESPRCAATCIGNYQEHMYVYKLVCSARTNSHTSSPSNSCALTRLASRRRAQGEKQCRAKICVYASRMSARVCAVLRCTLRVHVLYAHTHTGGCVHTCLCNAVGLCATRGTLASALRRCGWGPMHATELLQLPPSQNV
jgi:hypothetical protein